MKNSVVFLTRKCPRKCTYCKIRDNSSRKELSTKEWIRAFGVLREIGVSFNLILGNEPWLLGKKLPIIMGHSPPYGLYTSCYPPLFNYFSKYMFDNGINNLSSGCDYPISVSDLNSESDIFIKSREAFCALTATRINYPTIDCQATITLTRENYIYLPRIISDFQNYNVRVGVNLIHWDKDGGYDFCSPKEEMESLIFKPKDASELKRVFDEALSINNKTLHVPEYLQVDPHLMIEYAWHCKGDPNGGPTIDADGSLRLCGYRKGIETPKISIFDLPQRLDDWKEAVLKDSKNCPGCYWSCPWTYSFWNKKDPVFGEKVFIGGEKYDYFKVS